MTVLPFLMGLFIAVHRQRGGVLAGTSQVRILMATYQSKIARLTGF